MDIDSPGSSQAVPGASKATKGPREKVLPLRAEGFGSFAFWKKEIKAAEQKRDDDLKPDWDRNVVSYLCRPLISTPDIDKIIVPEDFANVEQKIPQLFFQLPKIICKPQAPQWESVAPLAQAVLQRYLSRYKTDAQSMMGEVLFDALCPAGIMCSKIGYESIADGMKVIQIPQTSPQAPPQGPPAPGPPNTLGAGPSPGGPQQPGNILGMNEPTPPPPPISMPVPRIISERYFWERISPAKILLPEKWSGSNYDLAPWLGFEFLDPWDVAKRKWGLTDDDVARFSGDDDHKIRAEKNVTTRAAVDTIRGWEIYYRAALYDPTEKNPDCVRLLVLLDGYEKPVRHKNSPYQKEDPQTGKLHGMKGYPIHIGALRYVSDMAFPPSECTINRTLVDEESRFRTQSVLMRDRAVPNVFYDEARMGGPQTAEKVRRGIPGAWIPLPSLDNNNLPWAEGVKAQLSQDTYRGGDYIKRDIEQVWAFGPNQHGQEALESRSATEMNIAQAAANTRMSKDRAKVVDYFMKGAEKLWALLQLFGDQEEFIQIFGADGSQRWQQWDKTQIDGEYVFEAVVDSTAQMDAASELKRHINAYELLAKDPNVNRVEILHKIAQFAGYDQARLIVDQIPSKGPEPPKVGFSFKGEDLDTGNPSFPIVLAVLRQGGFNIPDDLIQQVQAHKQMQSAIMAHSGVADPQVSAGMFPAGANGVPPTPQIPQEHGGMAPKAERLNKHSERTTLERAGPKVTGPRNRNRNIQ